MLGSRTGSRSAAGGSDRMGCPCGTRSTTSLRQELTQHWYPHAVNRARGGFHQSMARDWSLEPDENAFLVYQARMTWTAAAFARLFSALITMNSSSMPATESIFSTGSCATRSTGDSTGSSMREGRLDPRLGDEKHVYGTAFVVYAASKVRAVTGDELALKVARDAFDWLEQHAHDRRARRLFRGDRAATERRSSRGTPMLPIARRTDRLGVYYGFKSMNSHIHLLEALTELSRVDDRPIVRERLRETFLRGARPHRRRARRLEPLPDARLAADPRARLVRPRRRDRLPARRGRRSTRAWPMTPKTWHVARLLVDHALDWGWDDEHGGFYDKGESFGGEAFDRKKVWWTQAEGLNALLLMHEKYRGSTDRYGKAFLKQWAFIEKHLIDPVHGGWYAET